MKYKHIEQLTWLRGIAAFLVIVAHSIDATKVKYSDSDVTSRFPPMDFMGLGFFGVALFFVLSGCALWISNRRFDNHRGIIKFYIKRVFRIWPAFFVSVLIYLVFIQIFQYFYLSEPRGLWIEFLADSDFSFINVLQYLSLTSNLTGPDNIMNVAYWSLPVEFQFYIIFPVLIAAILFTRALGLIFIAIALYFIGSLQLIEIDRYEVFTLAFTFCGGILIGYLYTEKKVNIQMSMRWGIILLILLFTLAAAVKNNYFHLPKHIFYNQQLNWNLYGLLAILSVFVVLYTKFDIKESFITRFLKQYGEISYSTYLYHNIFVGASVLIIVNTGLYGDEIKLFFTFFLTLFFSYFAALYSYRYIELPGINLGRQLIKKLQK
ncbi:MAG: acyltransferase [Gammaproteobacteria bacterium]|nr:acyltransferase [Gammaproteobacteria bacterium]